MSQENDGSGPRARTSRTLLGARLGGELLVIVLGVSVALWAEGWRQAVEDRRLESVYLERLTRDFEVNQRVLERIQSESRETIDAANTVLAFLDAPETQATDTMAVLNAAAYAAFMRESSLRSTTFDELVASGQLTLIQDPDLRAELAVYYDQAVRRSGYFEVAPAAFRDLVTRTLPPGFTREAQQCEMERRGLVPAGSCLEPSLTSSEGAVALEAFRASSDLHGMLAQVIWYARHVAYPYLHQEQLNAQLLEQLGRP